MKSKITLIITFLLVQFSFGQWTQIGADINGEAAFDRLADLRQLAISADGTIVAAGAAGNDTNGNDSGLVRVYKNVNNTWVQLGNDLNGLGSSDRFGECINLSANGQILAVGEPGEDNISLYELVNNDWQIVAKTSSINTPNDIGNAVAMNADGTYLASAISNAIYIYNYSNSAITRESVIVLDGTRNFLSTADLELSADGTVLVVGNRQYNGNNDGTEDGRVLVYEKVNNVWQLKGAPIISNNNERYFADGIDISADGNVIAIGSPHTEVNGKTQAGFARTYKFENGDWVQLGSDINGLTNNSNLGRSVSINDDATVLAVGSDGSRGIAQIFKLENNDWVQISSTLIGEDSGDAFGSSIALSQNGGIVAIGGSDNDGNGSNSGHIRVYENLSDFPSITNIPDVNFEQYLVQNNIDSDGIIDGKVLTADIQNVLSLDLSQQNISDLTGIENFSALSYLNLFSNDLTSINVSKNIQLQYLYVGDNNISNIDVSANVNLIQLGVGQNSLTNLNVSNNTELTHLIASLNSLSAIDVSNNLKLIELKIDDNSISNLDVTLLKDLEILWASKNDLTQLNVTQNTKLKNIIVHENELTSLDFTLNTVLETIRVWSNKLTFLDVKNGNNTAIIDFESQQNPDLICIKVDDANYSNSNADWTKDSSATFSSSCYEGTFIPDNNFEAYIESQGWGNGVTGDNYVDVNAIKTVTTVDASSKNISDLTGIEGFESLINLNIRENTISSIDLTNNINLETLDVFTNNLTQIDVSKNTKLKEFHIGANQITNLNVSMLPDLMKLWTFNNTNLALLDLTNNTLLEVLNCSSNNIAELNLNNNLELQVLYCDSNVIMELDLSNNGILTQLIATYNNLNSLSVKNGNNTNITAFFTVGNTNLDCIEVDDSTYSTTNWTDVDNQTTFNTSCPKFTMIPDSNFEEYLENEGYGNGTPNDGLVRKDLIEVVENLNIESKNISDVTGLEDFAALTELNAKNNSISQVDVSQNTNLEVLFLANNTISNLDISQNLALKTIDVGENDLTFLEVSQLANLQSLSVYKNNLTTINLYSNKELLAFIANENQLINVDIRENNKLFWIDVDDNALEDLTIKNGNNNIITQFSASGNPSLTCIEVDDVVYSTSAWSNDIDNTASFSTDCAPANDDCSRAIALNFNQQTPGDVNSGTANNNPTCAVGNVLADVWFTVTVPETREFSIEGTTPIGNLKFAVYQSCQSNTPIACGNSISLTNLTVGTTFYLKVWIESGSSKSVANENTGLFSIKASESSVLSLDSFTENEASLQLYPNPTVSDLFVKLSNNIALEKIEIFTILGKKMITRKNINTSETNINLSHLSSGVYLLKAKTAKEIISKRIIIK